MKQPAILVQIVLLAIIFASPSYGDGLKHWLTKASDVSVGVSIEQGSITSKAIQCHVEAIMQHRKIEIAKAADSNQLYIFNGGPPDMLDKKIKPTATNFLPFDENKATFMHLNHQAFGNWFATSPLSGCDVWIADAKNVEPVVIHINANKLDDKPLQNLKYKEDLAKKVLMYLNQKTHQYKFILRVSYDFAKDEYTSFDEQKAIDNYWNVFKKDYSDVPFVLYQVENYLGFLYGTHDSQFLKLGRAWNFLLKDLGNGDILKNVECSDTQVGCSIMQL